MDYSVTLMQIGISVKNIMVYSEGLRAVSSGATLCKGVCFGLHDTSVSKQKTSLVKNAFYKQ